MPPDEGRDLPDYIAATRVEIDIGLARSGAVLFRGFDAPSVDHFDAAVRA